MEKGVSSVAAVQAAELLLGWMFFVMDTVEVVVSMTNASRLPSALDELCNDIPVERRAAERKTIHDPAVAECKKKVGMVQCALEAATRAHQSESESCNLLPPKIQILCCFSFLFVLTARVDEEDGEQS